MSSATCGAVEGQTASVVPAQRVTIGRWRWPATIFCGLMLLASAGLPVCALVGWIMLGLARQQPVGMEHGIVFNSTLAATLAAIASIVAAAPIVFLVVRHRNRFVATLDRVTYIGNALPGIVIALSLVFFGANYAPGWLYQSLPLLVFAYVVRFLPQAVGAMRASLLQVNPRLEEAARGLGRSRPAVFFSVTLPLIMPGILAGGALVFLTTIKELPITLLLHPTNFDTLVGEIWWTTSAGLFSRAALPGLLLVCVSALSIAVILHQERRQENV